MLGRGRQGVDLVDLAVALVGGQAHPGAEQHPLGGEVDEVGVGLDRPDLGLGQRPVQQPAQRLDGVAAPAGGRDDPEADAHLAELVGRRVEADVADDDVLVAQQHLVVAEAAAVDGVLDEVGLHRDRDERAVQRIALGPALPSHGLALEQVLHLGGSERPQAQAMGEQVH